MALARALVNEPDVLLLDAPMSALDARLRAQVQEDLRRLQRKLGRTFILVTHDQAEALVCSDRIAVMRNGHVVQCGTPEAVYDNPRDSFVAKFLGAANLISARRVPGGVETPFGFLALEKAPSWQEGTVAIRPEWIGIGDQQPERNGIRARVTEIVYRGTNFDLWLEPGPLRVRTSSYRRIDPGREVWLELAPQELVVLDDEALGFAHYLVRGADHSRTTAQARQVLTAAEHTLADALSGAARVGVGGGKHGDPRRLWST